MHHENTRLYKVALDIVSQSASVAKRLPPGYAFLADQLRRASTSIPLNFSEGCRKHSAKERALFFERSSGSSREVSTIMDVAFGAEAIDAVERDKIKDLCDYACAMLHKFERG